MKIILTSENSIRLIPDAGPMTIEAPSAEQQYSPFHMLGSSLAFCTFSVMYAWATHGKIPVDDLTLDVAWEFAEDPHRVGSIAMSFDWPSLPEKRVNAARRAAELCTVHATLMHPPAITVTSSSEGSPMKSDDRKERSEAPPKGPDSVENARDAQAEGGAAELPPKPVQQGDGQEAGTAKPPKPPVEAR